MNNIMLKCNYVFLACPNSAKEVKINKYYHNLKKENGHV